MNELISQWKKEEVMPFSGWDFSYIHDRTIDPHPEWDYAGLATEKIGKAQSVLDMGTGGGERFSSFAPFPPHAVAIEGYHPNFLLAKERLEPLGVKVIEVDEKQPLPFKDGEFDLVLNRHSGFTIDELKRILSSGGTFLTQQVPSDNLSDLVGEFISEYAPSKEWTLEVLWGKFRDADFDMEKREEWEGKMIFKDIGALVYYLKAIPWIVPEFSVDRYIEQLTKLQERLEKEGKLSFTSKRFLIEAKKK